MVLVAPSLLAADFRCLERQIKLVEDGGADWLHLDVMDGHFVPNLSFGADIIRQLRGISKLFFDVHLMVENPYNFLAMFAECGANQITVHYEAGSDLQQVIAYIKARGICCGVSLKPQTPASVLEPFIDEIDNVLVMTVEPGFGGQPFMNEHLSKIAEIKRLVGSKSVTIEVDGGVNLQTAAACVAGGADVLVAGNAIFKAENPAAVIRELHQLGE